MAASGSDHKYHSCPRTRSKSQKSSTIIMAKVLGQLFTLACILYMVVASSGKFERTKPDRGAVVVDLSGKYSGSYMTINAAVAALHNKTDAQKIFIFPGTYVEQVYIPPHAGPLTVQGCTDNASGYKDNGTWINIYITLETCTNCMLYRGYHYRQSFTTNPRACQQRCDINSTALDIKCQTICKSAL